MRMDLFRAVKENITAREAAERYGLKVSHSGMACCPFHNDHHPSLKLDERFYCFGCHATGDVIDFVARYLNLSPGASAKRIAVDFQIPYDGQERNAASDQTGIAERMKMLTARQQQKEFLQWKRQTLTLLDECQRKLEARIKESAPRNADEPFARAFIESCHDQDRVAFYKSILEIGGHQEQVALFNDRMKATDLLIKQVMGIGSQRPIRSHRTKRNVAAL